MPDEYRICTKCEVSHVENCGTCFGFGVYSILERPGEIFPIAAGEAQFGLTRGEQKPCPECGSTIKGING